MSISEIDITSWAGTHACRNKLPVLVRRLIRETAPCLTALRFPGNEAVDLPGFDGQAENSSQTLFVPGGRSIWEMGCNQNPLKKANADYEKRTNEIPADTRKTLSFVFVTPRRWPNKDTWLSNKRKENQWGAVYVYDATDLETWLEEAPVTSRWLGEILGVMMPGLLTPCEWWKSWATASNPELTMKLVSSRRQDPRSLLIAKLRRDESAFSIQADDKKEAVAFVIASLIQEAADDILDRMLIATSSHVRISSGSHRMIVITDFEDGGELGFGDRTNLTIIRPCSKELTDSEDTLVLSHVPSEDLRQEL